MSKIEDKGVCPECHSTNDGHTEVHGEKVEPADGDISICAYCGTLSRYVVVGDVRKLAPISDKERDELMKYPEIQQALAFARTFTGA